MSAPDLLVLAFQRGSLDAIMAHLNEIGFSKYCTVKGSLIDEVDPSLEPDLILVTNQSAYDHVKHDFNEDMPYIIARRSINFANVKDLLSLPSGSRVYLVSNMKEATKQTINILMEAGIVHQYVPYHGEGEAIDPSITVAVTPGELTLVPDSIRHTINIGHRQLDMTTLFEIYEFFGISTFASGNQLTAKYMQSIVSLATNLSEEMNQSRGLLNSLKGVVDRIEEGLIVYDQFNHIISINTQALYLLNKENSELIQQDIRHLPREFYQVFKEAEMEKENFVDIHEVPYYIRKKRIFVETKVFATIIIFEQIDRIKKIETNYRKSNRDQSAVAKYNFTDFKTNSQKVLSIIQKARKMAKSNSTIFIHGETGTGKELMAQAIHKASDRSNEPFVAVNLAAIAESLAESELFGYEQGAFTGARKEGNIGLFERAHKGTIFLDEIGDASPIIQNRLLRVLEEREIQRVGGGPPIPVDIRVITATNRNLNELIEEKVFREDLYYRLNILPIHLIPLRKRREDIMLLTELFTKEFEEKLQRKKLIYSNAAINGIVEHDWPGNVRELKNTIEYLSHVCENQVMTHDLPFHTSGETDENQHGQEEMIEQTLKRRGFLTECVQILTIFREVIDNRIGRNQILKIMSGKNIRISEQKLRYRLEVLAEMNLIDVGKGRKGSMINSEGERFLLYLEEKSSHQNDFNDLFI